MAEESNYVNDFYRALQVQLFGEEVSGEVDVEAWKGLFKRHDSAGDGAISTDEFKSLAKQCRIRQRIPSDAEVDLL